MADMRELRHGNVNVVIGYHALIDPDLLDAQMDPQRGQEEATGKVVDDLRHCNIATTFASNGAH